MELQVFLEECLKVSETAYRQELDRQKSIGTKLDYMFKWLTIFVAIGNIGVPLIAEYVDQSIFSWIFWILYVIISCCLVGALLLIILIQFPKKQVYFPLGTDICRKAKNTSLFEKEEKWYYQQILYWDNITKSLEQKNSKAIKILKIINVLFVIAIVLLSVL